MMVQNVTSHFANESILLKERKQPAFSIRNAEKKQRGECPLSHDPVETEFRCPAKSNCNQPICTAKHPIDRRETICKFKDLCKMNKAGKCPLSHPNAILMDLIKNVRRLEGCQNIEQNQYDIRSNGIPFHKHPSRRTSNFEAGNWRGQYANRHYHY